MKLILVVVGVFLLVSTGFSQRYIVNGEIKEINTDEYKKKGYIVKDSVTHQGYIDIGIKGENSRFCKYRKFIRDTVHIYTTDDIEEWGVYEESEYKRYYIEKKSERFENVFLKVLSKGKFTFLCLENRNGNIYYLEDTLGNITELKSETKKELQNDVRKFIPTMEESQVKLLNLKEDRLKSIFDKHNSGSNKAILYTKFGVLGGVGFTNFNKRFTALGIWSWADITTQVTPEIGLFLELYLFKNLKKITFQPQLIYSRFTYDYNAQFTRVVNNIPYLIDQTLDIDIKSFKLPLLFRYNSLNPKLAPFVDVGLLFSYNVNDIKIVSLGGPPGIKPIKDESLSFDKVLGGASIGGGLKYPLDYKRTILLGAHYEWMIGISDRQRPIFSNIVVKLGLSF